jgi:hypothetical protein
MQTSFSPTHSIQGVISDNDDKLVEAPHVSDPPRQPKSEGTPAFAIDRNKRIALFGGNSSAKPAETPPDIDSMINEVSGIQSRVNPHESYNPKELFQHIERIFTESSAEPEKIAMLQQEVVKLLHRIILSDQTPDNINKVHKFFFYAVPQKPNWFLNKINRLPSFISSYKDSSNKPVGEQTIKHQDAISNYRNAVANCIVRRYNTLIGDMIKEPDFLGTEFGVSSWQFQLLVGIKDLLEQRTLPQEALSNFEREMGTLNFKLLEKDFTKGSDFPRDVIAESACLLGDIKSELRKHHTN